jgi:hypothetical protein
VGRYGSSPIKCRLSSRVMLWGSARRMRPADLHSGIPLSGGAVTAGSEDSALISIPEFLVALVSRFRVYCHATLRRMSGEASQHRRRGDSGNPIAHLSLATLRTILITCFTVRLRVRPGSSPTPLRIGAIAPQSQVGSGHTLLMGRSTTPNPVFSEAWRHRVDLCREVVDGGCRCNTTALWAGTGCRLLAHSPAADQFPRRPARSGANVYAPRLWASTHLDIYTICSQTEVDW